MDYELLYEWNSGSIPPPEYYEIRIVIAPDGSGILECKPDYAFNKPPTWNWQFTVPKPDLDHLDTLVARAKHQTTVQSGKLTIGGPSESFVQKRGNQTEPLAGTAELVAITRAVVGEKLWAQVQTKRDEYIRTHNVR